MLMRFLSAPQFWQQEKTTPAAKLLKPVSALYGKIVLSRMRQEAVYKAHIPVICVGNFIVGGSGKTPTAMALADFLKTEGKTPGFLLRGFGGKIKQACLVESGRHTADEVGDEALLYARLGPTAVSADRPKGAQLLESAGVDAILMDDGFQNPALYKDCSLIVIDAETGFGNGLTFPAGPLRAPLSGQIPHAEAFILLGTGGQRQSILTYLKQFDKPVFSANIVAEGPPKLLAHKGPVIAFTGIGRPEKFFTSLEKNGFVLKGTFTFPDHHPFCEKDAQAIVNRADKLGGELITTAKDHVRLAHAKPGSYRHTLYTRAQALCIKVIFDDSSHKQLRSKLSRLLA